MIGNETRTGERDARRRDLLALSGACLLALALRLYDLTGESLWYDEAYSVWTGRMAISSLRTLWEWQIEFPLYYLLLHYWIRCFGYGELAVRLYSALAGAATVIPLYLLGKRLFDLRVGTVAALLLAVNPYHVWYSQEVRMFPWAILLSTLSLYTFWQVLDDGRRRWWIFHGLVTGLGFHVHYYILWLVLAQDLFLFGWLWRKHGRPWDVAARPLWHAWAADQAIVWLLALPAFLVFRTKTQQFNQWGWLAERYGAPNLDRLAELTLVFATGLGFPGAAFWGWGIALAMVGLAGGAVLWGIRRARDPLKVALVVSSVALPLLWVFLIGQWTALWVPRHLALFLPFFLLLVALGTAALPRHLMVGVVLLLLGCGIYSLSGIYRVPQKEDWRSVAAYLADRRASGDRIVLMDAECRVPYEYYAERPADLEISRFADEATLKRATEEILAMSAGRRIWLVISHADGSGLRANLEAAKELERLEAPEFVGIEVVGYRWR
ncbi:MAG: glycosyltransferase family 39 protein [Chloroflexi bacterium]|nr:glycosyltransferase family 39 protein [Chloroflexota bacterium]